MANGADGQIEIEINDSLCYFFFNRHFEGTGGEPPGATRAMDMKTAGALFIIILLGRPSTPGANGADGQITLAPFIIFYMKSARYQTFRQEQRT